jgi:hypothetical protein
MKPLLRLALQKLTEYIEHGMEATFGWVNEEREPGHVSVKATPSQAKQVFFVFC